MDRRTTVHAGRGWLLDPFHISEVELQSTLQPEGEPGGGDGFLQRRHWVELLGVLGSRWDRLCNGGDHRVFAGAGRLLNTLIGGWDLNTFYTASSGEPADLPGNAIMLHHYCPGDESRNPAKILRAW